MRFLLVTIFFTIASLSVCASVEYGGYMMDGSTCLIILRDTASKDSSPWLKVGETWRGNKITAFDLLSKKLAITRNPVESVIDLQPTGDGPRKRLIEVRARPQRGFMSKSFERLILEVEGKTYRVDWSMGSIHNPPVLSADREYDFVLNERSFPALYGKDVWHDIHRVSDAGRVLFDGDVCEVHQIGLTPKEIPTRHGYSGLRILEMEIRKHHFPHAEGGRTTTCEPIPGESALTEIHLCAQCDAAYAQWKKEPDKFTRP